VTIPPIGFCIVFLLGSKYAGLPRNAIVKRKWLLFSLLEKESCPFLLPQLFFYMLLSVPYSLTNSPKATLKALFTGVADG
jgi:hypothetical protein